MAAQRDGNADALRRILLVDAADRLYRIAREMDGDAAHRLVELTLHKTAGECSVLARENHGIRRHLRREMTAHAIRPLGEDPDRVEQHRPRMLDEAHMEVAVDARPPF